MNYNGEDVELAQHNMDVAIPFVLSTRKYGAAVGQQFDHPLRRSEALPCAEAGDGSSTAQGWTRDLQRQRQGDRQRSEPAIDLQYLENRKDWPAGTRTPDGGEHRARPAR